jgi:hypothetical protein
MKNVISYVSGTGGDFLVNCCNQLWSLEMTPHGSVNNLASTKWQENQLNDVEWLELVNNLPYSYVGTHLIDRLLRLPVAPWWIVVPDINSYYIWARRDCVTRSYKTLLGPSGDFFLTVKELVLTGKSKQAAENYLEWITNYNWGLMQMRLVQNSNKIDVSGLLDKNGMDYIVDQIPQLKLFTTQCRHYHSNWLNCQIDLSESSVINLLSEKLSKFVFENC